MTVAAATALLCGETFDISTVNVCHEQALTILDSGAQSIEIDTSQVTRTDTAALQWLAVFRRAALAEGIAFQILAPSECLIESAALLGLAEELGFDLAGEQ